MNHTRILLLFIFLSFNLSGFALNLRIDLDKLNIKSKNKNTLQATNIHLSEYQKKTLLREVIRQIYATGRVINIPEVSAYISSLGIKIITNKAHIKFLVLKDQELNAFASLGGMVVVHSGLILTAESEGELASVLAHEVAHIYNHHIEQIIASTNSTSTIALQSILLAMAVASAGSNTNVTQAALISAIALPAQQMIKYTRLHEIDADATGIQFLSEAGYDPNNAITMLQKLALSNKFRNSPPEFLLTHPLSNSRISSAENIIKKIPKKKYFINNDDFYAIQAILKLEHGQFFYGINNRRDVNKVAYAIYLQRAGKTKMATKLILDVMQNSYTDSIYFKLLVGRYFQVSNMANKALFWYQKAYQQNPNNFATIIRLVNELLHHHDMQQAKKILDKAIINFPQSPEIYQMFALFYSKNNQLALSYYWHAESEFLFGSTNHAIQQLLLAKKNNVNNFYLDAKIDAKIEEYQRINKLERAH